MIPCRILPDASCDYERVGWILDWSFYGVSRTDNTWRARILVPDGTVFASDSEVIRRATAQQRRNLASTEIPNDDQYPESPDSVWAEQMKAERGWYSAEPPWQTES